MRRKPDLETPQIHEQEVAGHDSDVLFLPLAAFGLVSLISANPNLRAQANPDWHRPFPAFKIAGNLYYVGTADLAVYLVNTPQGNILINSDFKEDVPLIRKSIEQLGFKYTDTKILLISHAHGDHDEGVGLIKQETGAKLMVMDADVPEEESTAPGRPGAHVDRVLHDGDTVELGGAKLTAHLTPGHTKGCTTWTMQVREGGRTLNAVIIGSPNVNAGYLLVGNKDYPANRAGLRQDLSSAQELALRSLSGSARRLFRPEGQVRKDEGRRTESSDRSGWLQGLCGRTRGDVSRKNGNASSRIPVLPRHRPARSFRLAKIRNSFTENRLQNVVCPAPSARLKCSCPRAPNHRKFSEHEYS